MVYQFKRRLFKIFHESMHFQKEKVLQLTLYWNLQTVLGRTIKNSTGSDGTFKEST